MFPQIADPSVNTAVIDFPPQRQYPVQPEIETEYPYPLPEILCPGGIPVDTDDDGCPDTCL